MHVAIIGNGVAGVAAAFEIRKRQPEWRITMISGESRYHYSRPALMYIFMGHMRYQDTKPFEDRVWEEKRIDLLRAWVTGIDVATKTLTLHGEPEISYDRLVIATGSKPNRFGWAGQDLDGVQGLWGLPDLKLLHENAARAERAVIVGGGLIGIELGEMLHSRGIHVTFLVREPSYWNNVLPPEESALVNEEIRRHGVELLLDSELDRIEDDGKGRVGAIVTKDGRRIECELVGLTAGVSPNVDLARSTEIPVGRGVLVNEQLATQVPDVWACGDCAEIVTPEGERNIIEQVWYTGQMQGEIVGANIAGEDLTHRQPTWWNSAKFFDLEYQTYGRVHRRIEGERNLVWTHPTEAKCIRVVDLPGEGVIGVQTMGIRFRHRTCEQWIEEKRSAEWVLEHLSDANFDPEFFARHEREAAATMKEQMIR
jgi:NADPH-dependent 2,4-dienoyl-CoA reductase/sulfur reductase-like enzyme